MNIKESIRIYSCEFESGLFKILSNEFPPVKDKWPIIYILISNKRKKAYVGQTSQTYTRLQAHLKDGLKSDLSKVYLIYYNKGHKSLIEELESFLIRVMHADKKYRLMNGNLGLKESSYYQQHKLFPPLFEKVWPKLQALHIAQHSLEYITNSSLFKYSPYKALGKQQKKGLIMILESLLNKKGKHVLIEGGAGTGKSILAIFVFKLLNTPIDKFNYDSFEQEGNRLLELVRALQKKYNDPTKMALVIPMSSFRATIQKSFKYVSGLNSSMVIGPGQAAKRKYDLLFVDESHRLRRYNNLGRYFNNFKEVCKYLKVEYEQSSELQWILNHQAKSVFFYDKEQSIRPSDIERNVFDKFRKDPATTKKQLTVQFRVQGGVKYVRFVKNLLSCKLPENRKAHFKEYHLLLFNDIRGLINEIRERDQSYEYARLTAGFAWKWVSRKNKKLYDIKINKSRLRWNSPCIEWINSPKAPKEVGCIHKVQGYDLNFAGIIFGPEISYDKKKNEIVIYKDNYWDENGKKGIADPDELKRYIINVYKTLMLRGVKGTFLYACDKDLRAYLSKHIPVSYKVE
jgi:uncharacterized protein